MKKVFLLIDAHALLHRAYHALPPLTTASGQEVGALFGFSSSLLKVLEEVKPTAVAAAFDLPKKTFRHELYTEYKATREKTTISLSQQIQEAPGILEVFGIQSFSREGYEADDVIASAVSNIRAHEPDTDILILTGDLDTLQLVDERTRVLTPQRGASTAPFFTYDIAAVKKRFGVPPDKMIEYKALVGDPSDNIPGISGIGPKTALDILSRHDSVKKSLASKDLPSPLREKLTQALPRLEQFKKLITLNKDLAMPISSDTCGWQGLEKPKLEELFSRLEFRALRDRLRGERGRAKKPEHLSQKERESMLLSRINTGESTGLFSKKIADLERSLMPVIFSMEKTGILLDIPYLETLQKEMRAMLEEKQKKLFAHAGHDFNPASPQQVASILFEKLGISPRGLKKTSTGRISAAAPELEKIKSAHPIIPLLLEWRELAKLLSTYVEVLPSLASKDGRVHTTFDQLGAETGRISSSNPNLQNIPIKTEMGRKIRHAFIAAPRYVLLSADYSQIELRVAALLAHDETLLDIFTQGKDVHAATASKIFGVPEDDVTPAMRMRAKTINFGVLYGLGPDSLAQEAGLSREEARDFIAAYFANFAGLARYIQDAKEKARREGYVETFFGRKRFLQEIHSPNPRERAYAERIAINMPVQGTAADVVKIVMVKIFDALTRKNADLRLLLQVHDELLFEVREEKLHEFAPAISRIMEEETEFPLRLSARLSYGLRWTDLIEYK